jgi:hypothetical protein
MSEVLLIGAEGLKISNLDEVGKNNLLEVILERLIVWLRHVIIFFFLLL